MSYKNIYTTGEYIQKNHSYHIEDSSFKWNNFLKILKKFNFNFENINSVTEVGCGSGQILVEARESGFFKKNVNSKVMILTRML